MAQNTETKLSVDKRFIHVDYSASVLVPRMDIGKKLEAFRLKKEVVTVLPKFGDQLKEIEKIGMSEDEAESVLWFCNKFTITSDPKGNTNSNKRTKIDFLEKVKRSLIARQRGVPVSQVDKEGKIIKKNEKGEIVTETETVKTGKEGKEEDKGVEPEKTEYKVDMVEETKRFSIFNELLKKIDPALHQWSLLLAHRVVEDRANFLFDIAYSNITGAAKGSDLSVRLIKFTLMPGVLRACTPGRAGSLLILYSEIFKVINDDNKRIKYNSKNAVETAPLGALAICFVNLKEITNRHEFKIAGNVSRNNGVVFSASVTEEGLRNCITFVMDIKTCLEWINQQIPKFFTKQTTPTGLIVTAKDSLETKLWKETIVAWNTFKAGKDSKNYWYQGSKVRNFGATIQTNVLNQFVENYKLEEENKKKLAELKKTTVPSTGMIPPIISQLPSFSQN